MTNIACLANVVSCLLWGLLQRSSNCKRCHWKPHFL